MSGPITRYRPSARRLPERLGNPEYASRDEVRTVGCNGELRFGNARYKVTNALRGHKVAIRPRNDQDGLFDVFFAHHRCLTIDLRQSENV